MPPAGDLLAPMTDRVEPMPIQAGRWDSPQSGRGRLIPGFRERHLERAVPGVSAATLCAGKGVGIG